MSQTNTIVKRTVVKIHKKTNCSYCDFLPSNVIATTPEEIDVQIAKFNAVEDSSIDFIAFPEIEYNADIDSDDDNMPVHVSKAYSTNENGDCQDNCKATYCLLIVEMTEEMHQFEMAGKPRFYIAM